MYHADKPSLDRSRRISCVVSKITRFKSVKFFLLGLFKKYVYIYKKCLRECNDHQIRHNE